MSNRMGLQDSLSKNQTSDQPRNNNRKLCRAFSVGSPPYLALLRSRRENAEIYDSHDDTNDRRLVRSQSEGSFPFQAWRNSSCTMDLKKSQELYCNSGKEPKEWKLPSIPQRNEVPANQYVEGLKEMAPTALTMHRRRSLCALPDLSKGPPRAFRATTPLRKQQVEEVNNNFDSLTIKSQNLAKWLRDQR